MRYALDADVIKEIVETVAEHLEVKNLGIEEAEVLTHVVAMSIALYLSKLNPENDQKGKIQ